MTVAISMTSQIRAQVSMLSKKRPEDRIIGIRTTGRWTGAETEVIEGQEYHFIQSNSTLEIRQRLVETAASDLPVVVLTSLSDAEIGFDLLTRFSKRRFYTLHPWEMVQELFQARDVDPKLWTNRWLAEALLENVPAKGYKPVASGMLDQETVWAILLHERMGLDAGRPDARDLLVWSLDAERMARYLAMPSEMREGIRGWILQSAGVIANLILDCVEAGYGEDVVPIGLACSVVFEKDLPELREAVVRLERFTGGKPIFRHEALQLAAISSELITITNGEAAKGKTRMLLDRLDTILKDIRADSFAHLSLFSPLGFEMQLERFGEALNLFLQVNPQPVSKELHLLAQSIFDHHEERNSQERVSRVVMAMRLLNWLEPESDFDNGSFVQAAKKYFQESSYVDRARYSLDIGDSIGILAKAYAKLAEIVTTRRQTENQRFAELLVNWTELGSVSNEVYCVEDLLREVVAKIARIKPVLLIVVDGMSSAVFSELLEDITAKGWITWGEGSTWPRPVISVLPSITGVSRTSLFCGRLEVGTANTERIGFLKNPDLLKVCRSGNPPVLFHKASLSETSGHDLAIDVRKEILSEKRKIVAVVVNAVDDHLNKGDQVAVPWTLKHLPVIEQLLYAARDSGRVVILTSDHGHILERQTTYRKSEPGERYRADDGKPLSDEFAIAGKRVLGLAENRMIAPWSESVRYAGKKHGYHGGLTPQECIIPLGILTPTGATLNGWANLNYAPSEWWNVVSYLSEEKEVASEDFDTNFEHIKDESAKKSSLKFDERFPLFAISENESFDSNPERIE